MSNLIFQNTTLTVIPHNNQTYITSTDLACDLGYSDTRSITKIFTRNQDEFTADMSLVVNLTTKGFGNGNSEKDVRIFSLRGAHLIAMFSRTKVAKEFRKWVLDILDKETLQKKHEIRPLVDPNNEEEILALLTNNFYFCSLANEMIKKIRQAGLQDKIDLTLGGHYIYNLDHPLEQHLAKIKGYIQAKQERIMYIKGMLNLLDLEPPQTKRLPHTTF